MTVTRFDIRAPSAIGKWGRATVIVYVSALVALPLLALVVRVSGDGLAAMLTVLRASDARDALTLSIRTAAIAALVQAVLGTATALVLVRGNLPFRRALSAVVDIPLAMPTLVAGVMIVLLFGPDSALGRALGQRGVSVVYTETAIVLALLFVTFPFVVRAVEPVLLELDPAEEEAAATLGAGRLLTLRTVIFPAIAPAVLSGAIRTFARALAEFGSLVVVSGNIPHRTLTAPVYVFGAIESGRESAATTVSLVIFAFAATLLTAARALEKRMGGRDV